MTDPTDLGRMLRDLDAQEAAIRREGREQEEYLRKLTRERLAQHARRRKTLLGLFAAMAAVAAEETKSA